MKRPAAAEPDDTGGSGLSGRPAVLLAVGIGLSAASVLCGYEMLRTTANTLFVAAYGKQRLPVILACVPLGVAVVVYCYGRLLSWLGPRKTLHVSTLLAIATMGMCFAAIRAGVAPARGVLYVFKETYVVLLIEQYWSYIDSMLSKKWAKRLNGPICGISSLGGMLGGDLLNLLSVSRGTLNMVLLAGFVTFPAVLLTETVFRRYGEPRRGPKAAAGGAGGDHLGFQLFAKNRMLVLLICLIATTQLLATVLDLSFTGLLTDQIKSVDAQTALAGRFWAWLYRLAMIAQFIIAPLVLWLFSLRYIHLAIPIVHLAACGYLLAAPSLFRAGLALMVFKCLDYSVFRAAKELLYVPLSFDVRYRAKEIIDVLGYRVSKGVTSLGITMLQYAGVTFSASIYAFVGMVGAGAWLGLVWPISRYDRERAPQQSNQQ